MYEFHRVFTRWNDDLWVGVNWAVHHKELTPFDAYVTLSVKEQGNVCLTLQNGQTLCDYGPEHDHDRP